MILLILKKKKYFYDKLKVLYKKGILNQTRHTEVKTELDKLEEIVKIISKKGLTANMVNIFLQMDCKVI